MKKFFAVLLLLIWASSASFAAGPSDDSLISAAQKGDRKRVQAILKLGSGFDGVLVHAIREKKVSNETIKILIDAGANVNGRDTWLVTGDTALMYCKDLETAKLLVNAGADVNLKNNDGLTALMRVSSPAIIEFLITSGANVDAMDNHYRTPLMWQVKQNNFGAVRTLLRYGADVLRQNEWGQTAYDYAPSMDMQDFLIDALSASDEEENEGDAGDELKLVVNGSGAILFSEPNLNSEQIMNLSDGDKLIVEAEWVTAEEDNVSWYYVHLENAKVENTKGWVQAKFVKEREPD